MSSVVAARDVVRSYGERRALDGLSLEVPAAGVFGLLGPNGSGKSTFITMVAAMERPDAGELTVFGQAPAIGLRARVGVVFQENAADPLMTVSEHLALAGRLFGVSRAEGRARAERLLGAFGLGTRAGDRTGALSGGMRRRLEAVRALLHEPELLLLDEPTTGVDPGERQSLWEALLTARESGRTVLLATNDLAEADAVCDRVAFIKDGKVVASGTPGELKRGLRREAVRVRWEGPPERWAAAVAALPGAGDVVCDGDVLHVTADDGGALVPRLFELGGTVRSVAIEAATLEDAYFQHVGRRAGAGVAK